VKVSGNRAGNPMMSEEEPDVLRSEGLDIPLLSIYDKPHVVVLGTRRAAALRARMRGTDRIPVLVAGRSLHISNWLQADLQVQGWRGVGRPWTWMERARVANTMLAAITPRPGRDPSLTRALAAYFGVPEPQLRNAAYIQRDFDRATGDEKRRIARAVIDVEAGKILPHSAMRRLNARIGWHPDSDTPPPTMTADRQAQMLGVLAGQLSGLLLGIEQMGAVHPDLTPEQRAELYPPLAKFRRALTRITRQINNTQGAKDEHEQD
jgi:hypothetical protein